MIAHASPPQRFSGTSPSPGFRLPSFCTALGRVLLSGFSDKELSVYLEQISLDAFTPHTVTDKQKLWEIIRQIRSDGYAVAEQEAEFGFRSIAVPVRRQDGRIVAAMNVGARVERVSSEALTAVFLPFLTNEAAYIQSLLP
jgi:IclR family pca regulon transcriptional regulator